MAGMTNEQRIELIRLLEKGEEISPEWARILFPPEKREYELVYRGKEREEDIFADTLAVPLPALRTFGKNGNDWHNMLIFGDNLQVMKSMLELKKAANSAMPMERPEYALFILILHLRRKRFSGTEDQKAYQDKLEGCTYS